MLLIIIFSIILYYFINLKITMILDEFEEMQKLFKMIGFWHTIRILKEYMDFYQRGEGILLKHFYKILNHFSYYNAFIRVKGELISRGIIEMPIKKNIKYIQLTKKGIRVYEILKLLNEELIKK